MKLASVYVVRMYGSRRGRRVEGVLEPLGRPAQGFSSAEELWRLLTQPDTRARKAPNGRNP